MGVTYASFNLCVFLDVHLSRSHSREGLGRDSRDAVDI
jgi:hypothetical protein